MKVLIVASKYLPEYTGAAFRIQKLYEYLRTHGIEAEVLCGGIERMQGEVYALDGMKVERLKCRWPSDKGGLAEALAFWRDALTGFLAVRKKQFDVLHVVGTSPLTAAAKHYAFFMRKPILIEMVTTGSAVSQGLPGMRKVWKPRLDKRSAVVAISGPLAEKAVAEGYGTNVWARPNPVDTAKFFYDPRARLKQRKALTPFGENDIVLGMIAKFMPQKNQAFLLEVLANLPEQYKLVLAGPLVKDGQLAERDAAYFAGIKHRIAHTPISSSPGLSGGPIARPGTSYAASGAMGPPDKPGDDENLSGRVHIVPDFVDAAAYMQACDAYMMPNTAEGLGTPMLEALACGLPVIANEGEAAFQAFHAGHPALPVTLEPLEAGRWAQAIMRVLPVPEPVRLASAAIMKKEYAFERVAGQYQALLKALTSAGRDDQINVDAVLQVREPDAP